MNEYRISVLFVEYEENLHRHLFQFCKSSEKKAMKISIPNKMCDPFKGSFEMQINCIVYDANGMSGYNNNQIVSARRKRSNYES